MSNKEQSDQKITETVEVLVGGLATGGSFVATVTDINSEHQGKKGFLREVCPEEKVVARIEADKGNYLELKSEIILEPSPQRTDPFCPYFGRCGGCDLQHIQTRSQREIKRQMVEETLLKQGKLQPQRGVTLAGMDLPDRNYRRRITLHIWRDGSVGFYEKGTEKLLEIDHCPITDLKVNETLRLITPLIQKHGGFRGDLILERHGDSVFAVIRLLQRYKKGKEIRFPKDLLVELKKTIPNIRVHLSKEDLLHQIHFRDVASMKSPDAAIGHFSQVNEEANSVLLETTFAHIKGDTITELYAGAGNFSLPLAKRGHKVIAVEADRALVALGRKRAAEKGVSAKLEFVRKSCEKFVRTGEFAETVLLDPPRSGAREAMEAIVQNGKTNEIIYVSCYLPTLVRDLQILSEAGFILEQTTIIDMFPQTHHVETVSVLRKNP